MARPTKLTDTVQANIIEAIMNGAYMETAAAFAGIDASTFHSWMKDGARFAELVEAGKPIIRPENQRLIEFHHAIKMALAQAEVRDINVIDDAAQDGVWQAAAWKLERKHHARWGRKVAVTDEAGGNFFGGFATAWAEALEMDQDEQTLPTPVPALNGGTNGSGG